MKQECLQQLMRYMVQHPEAMDTREGIREWWLRDSGYAVSDNELALAIEELESKGWLIRREMAASRALYRINSNGLEEMKTALQPGEISNEGR